MPSPTQSLTTLPTAPAPKPFNERLTGERIFDAQGNPAQPSDAIPFESDSPVPTMLVERELNYLHWLASNLEGTGRVVELGCFLGGSTSALAAGLRLNDRSTKPILTYDAFLTPPQQGNQVMTWLKPFRLKPNQNFRKQFNELNHDWMNLVDVREGFIPSNISEHIEQEIFPEQEPIELLFIDAAKSWDVHLTILHTFARHLKPSSIVVQQDFADISVPWVPLHMWQLRDVLEPIDVLKGTPTVAFRCVGDVAARLEELWSLEELKSSERRRHVWQQVREHWNELIGQDAAGFISGHEAIHAYQVGDPEQTTQRGRDYDAWSRSAQSQGVYYTPSWPGLVAQMPESFAKLGTPSLDICQFAAENAVRGSRLDQSRDRTRATYFSTKQRKAVWSSTLDRLRQNGHQRIAIFGAGQHTQWLLETYHFNKDIEITCILDDHPMQSSIRGIPVLTPDSAKHLLDHVTAILPSTDSFETQLLSRIDELFEQSGDLQIYPVYTHPDSNSTYGRYEVDPTSSPSELHPSSDDRPLDQEIRIREQLGLPQTRHWLDEFYQQYNIPNWTTGYTSQPDASFLWDLIESIAPQRTIEIGTASGVSTALLLGAIDQFCADDALLYSYDVFTCCYFDADRAIASALGEMAPSLLHKSRLFASADATDAVSHFSVGEVEFAFIDGDHVHPSPTLDLISLLYALKPESWVALHDIELSNIRSETGQLEWKHITGAEKLFHSWPYEKIQAEGSCPEHRNIGAIRMPKKLSDAVPHLLSLLQLPWETHTKPSPAIASALDRLTEYEE